MPPLPWVVGMEQRDFSILETIEEALSEMEENITDCQAVGFPRKN